ncbi:uncharacterized protein RJT21DRAFT_118720 [Scheffersomyces amazonensis]|uniref:uncharacterized protein n=1 Tax=Scheffersomyces amazonensis TaxID=1078765 RepID=UPI00315C65BE
MNSIYNHGLKQTQTISRDLLEFEKNLSTSPLSLQGAITTSITAFRKTIREYKDLVEKDTDATSNAKHEGRIEKFSQDLSEFTTKFDSLKSQREVIAQENNKQELLGRRHLHNPDSNGGQASENPYDPTNQQQQQQDLSYSEGLYNERLSLARGSQQLDHILEMGQQAFEDIVEQNEILRKVQAKFEQSLVTLGVSQGTIRSIEKRAKQDKWLFWFALILTLVIFWYIFKFFR